MSYGFEVGRAYNRVADIHAVFGGSQRSGIITTNAPGGGKGPIFIVTGNSGRQHGYHDRWRGDGAFDYFGEGQVGDMQMTKGNLAIATHAEVGRSILLFSREKNQALHFLGEFVYGSHHIERTPGRDGVERNAFVFELWPLNQIELAAQEAPAPAGVDLSVLRQRAYEASGVRKPIAGAKPRTIYERSADVRNYVLARSKGHCEGCTQPAPFLRANGSPYLEPHHIRRVSDGGPDHPGFVIALCPNCHRRVHAGGDGRDYNSQLLTAMATIEPNIWV